MTGFAWLFEKDELEKLVADFTKWNDELQMVLPYILCDMNVLSNQPLRDMLGRADEGSDFFGVHIRLQQGALRKVDPTEGNNTPCPFVRW